VTRAWSDPSLSQRYVAESTVSRIRYWEAIKCSIKCPFATSPGWLFPVNEALQPSHNDSRTTPVQTSGSECGCEYQFCR
jgi:hypothetical protein